MYDKYYSSDLRKMSPGRWTALFVAGLVIFFVLYGLTAPLVSLGHSIFLRILLDIGAGAALLALYLLWIRVSEKRNVNELFLDKMLPDLGRGLLVGLGFFVVIVGIMAAFGLYKPMSFSFGWVVFEKFAFFFLVAVAEEIIFRGVLFRMIDCRWNTPAALIVSMLLFGLAHLPNNGATLWSSVAIAVEAGLLLGAAFKMTGNLWFPIGIHWAWNFTEGILFGLPVSGEIPEGAIINPVVSGSRILTGGSFGPEASVITVVLGLILSLFFLYRSTQDSMVP